MVLDNKTAAFFELVRGGLWERDVELQKYGTTDYSQIMQLATEQSVVGLVAAGIERLEVNDSRFTIPQPMALLFAGQTLQLEQRNKAMNAFISELVNRLRKADIYTLLVKGQGVAQCYERPLWRAAGDIDLYLSDANYQKAKALLVPLAKDVEPEDKNRLHLGMMVDGWIVELHGTLHTGISRRINAVSDDIHYDIFNNGNVRSWNNNGVQVFLPSPNSDVIIIFNHFINHFYGEGIGLRQICDWCRLLYCYCEKLDLRLLESRIMKAGLMTEWKAFAAFAVECLGMPEDAMPFYSEASSFKKKAKKICKLILETGSLGNKKDKGYRNTSSKWKWNMMTFWQRLKEFARLSTIFPVNAPLFFAYYVWDRVKAVSKKNQHS